MLRIMGLAVVSALLISPLVHGQETYTLKLKKSAKGDVNQVEKSSSEQTQNKIVDDQQKSLQDKTEKKAESYAYRETILERDGDKPPTRLRRAYEKASVTTDGKTTELPYQGKTVLIEKKDGKFRFEIEGGKELTGEDAAYLSKEFNKKNDDELDFERAILPKKAVAVGETWKIDMEPLGKDFEKATMLPMDLGKCTGTGKLVKAYKQDGKQFGVLEIKLEMPLKAGKVDKLVVDSGSRVKVDVTMDVCVDGTAETGVVKAKMGIELKATIPLPGEKDAKLTLIADGIQEEKHKELPKK
ncbi:MAG: hypothetical protein K2R98_27245 [Gemmataceae bacterium]|nr:hypothetical protein [Gemmataceae bacterium]